VRPVDDAKVTARVTLPQLAVADAQKQFADRIAKLKLPAALREPKLTKDQQALVAYAAFAAGSRGTPGGLLKRTTVAVDLDPVGGGRYTTVVKLPAPGGVDVDVTATGPGWARRSQASGLIGVK
jgi:hypothetical protein